MIALDTNILVRLLVGDDAAQVAAVSHALGTRDDVLVLDTVLLETVWVLQSVYGASRQDVVAGIEHVLSLGIAQTPTAEHALRWFAEGMDFADALHLASACTARCNTLLSFDERFARAARGRTICTVTKPR